MPNIQRYDTPQLQQQGINPAMRGFTKSLSAELFGYAGQAVQIYLEQKEKNEALAADEATAKLQIDNKRREQEILSLKGINALRKTGDPGSFQMPPDPPPPQQQSEPGVMPEDPNFAAANDAVKGMMTNEDKKASRERKDLIEARSTIEAMKDYSSPQSPYAKMYEDMDKQVRELSAGLSGKAKERFLSNAWLHKEALTTAIMGHQQREQTVLAYETSSAKIDGYRDIIAKAPGSLVARNAINDMGNEVRDYLSKWKGLSGPALDNKVKVAISDGLVTDIKGIMAYDPVKAQARMEEVKGLLTADHELAISKEVNAAAIGRIAQDAADMIPSSTPAQDAIEWFNKDHKDPATREKFRVLVLEKNHDYKMAQQQRSEAYSNATYDIFRKNGNNPYAVLRSKEMDDFRARFPEEGTKTFEYFQRLADHLDDKGKKVDPTIEIGQYALYSKIMDQPDYLVNASFPQIASLTPVLGVKLVQKLMDEKRKIGSDLESAKAFSLNDIKFNEIAEEYGVQATGKRTDEQFARTGKLREMVQDAVISEARAKGGMVTPERKEQIMRTFLDKVAMRGWLRSDALVFELGPNDLTKMNYTDAELTQAVEALASVDLQASPANVNQVIKKMREKRGK